MGQQSHQRKEKRIFQSIVQNIALYEAKMWPMTTTIRNKLRSVELDYMRRCLQITKSDRVRTQEIWNRMEVKCSMTKNWKTGHYNSMERMSEERWPKRILE